MAPLTAFSPYSLENFKWLMANSSAALYLSEESLKNVDTALNTNDEAVLRQLFPIILTQYVSERDISINFALRQESAMFDFITEVEKAGYNVKNEIKENNRIIEEKEHREAENILKKIT